MHLVILIGPPAVGKMTVGQEIARRTTYRLFHNHLSIDPLVSVFDYGTPPFNRLRDLLRREVLTEALSSGLDGLIFTYVVALDDESDVRWMREFAAPVIAGGGHVDLVELTADLETRLEREGSANRVLHKSSKRDVDWARGNTASMERDHVMTSAGLPGPVPFPWPHFLVDTATRSAAEAADIVIDRLALPERRPTSA